jgi:trimeric autotransporter adhesin
MRRVVSLFAAVGVVFAGLVGSAFGAGTVSLCVPSGEGAAITTPSKGSCGSGTTVKLPSEAKEQEKLIAVLPYINYQAEGVGKKPTVQFTGVNLQVINGSGVETTINGTGNLIVGYDEKPKTQTGSHNLLVGASESSYSSYGGILSGGHTNTINGPYASVLGGAENTATGSSSAITGGHSNKTNASYSTIGGGCGNFTGAGTFVVNVACTTAYANDFTTVAGGTGNQAAAENSSVSGGAFNLTNDLYTSITGGCDNRTGIASFLKLPSGVSCNSSGAQYASISGGELNTASGVDGSVSGGLEDLATGYVSSVSGGNQNVAETEAASVSGGFANRASNGYTSVSGGFENTAAGLYSSVSGGETNDASGEVATANGGLSNKPTGFDSSTTGGDGNEAEGEDASVVGGHENKAKGSESSVVAGEFNVAEDPFSMIGGGCDDMAGSGTKNTNACDSGGEGIDGGASVAYKIKDGTGGLISDVSETSESMNVTDGAGACGNLGIGVSGGQIGDTSLFTFPTTGSVPPAALRLTPLGTSTAGFSEFQVCNSSASSITISDPVKVLTFR